MISDRYHIMQFSFKLFQLAPHYFNPYKRGKRMYTHTHTATHRYDLPWLIKMYADRHPGWHCSVF